MLQNYIFVPLDIFRKTMENKGIRNKLDAWLAKLEQQEKELQELRRMLAEKNK